MTERHRPDQAPQIAARVARFAQLRRARTVPRPAPFIYPIGESLALRDLNDLVSRGIFLKIGKTVGVATAVITGLQLNRDYID